MSFTNVPWVQVRHSCQGLVPSPVLVATSGIDTFSLSLQSNLLTSSSACHSSDDSCNLPHSHGRLSMEYGGNVFISSKCSDTDSAFGDASLASHDLSQDSQTSECFSLDMHPGSFHDEGIKRNYVPPCRQESSVVVDNRSNKIERECYVVTSEIPDTSAMTHSVSNTSSTNLSLPAPSWCSPVGTPGTIVKPSCTSTPKDSIQENINEMVKQFLAEWTRSTDWQKNGFWLRWCRLRVAH